jgi:hypothetical protein
MFLKSSTAVTLLAAVQAMALPSPAGNATADDMPGLIVIDTLDLGDGGAITYYGVDPAYPKPNTEAAY